MLFSNLGLEPRVFDDPDCEEWPDMLDELDRNYDAKFSTNILDQHYYSLLNHCTNGPPNALSLVQNEGLVCVSADHDNGDMAMQIKAMDALRKKRKGSDALGDDNLEQPSAKRQCVASDKTVPMTTVETLTEDKIYVKRGLNEEQGRAFTIVATHACQPRDTAGQLLMYISGVGGTNSCWCTYWCCSYWNPRTYTSWFT